MFDDFVQRSSLPAHSTSAGRHGPWNGYAQNGFEGNETGDAMGYPDAATLDSITALETGFNSADDPAATAHPIFQLGRVQYAFPAPLALLTVSSNILTMCLYAYPQGGILPQNLPPPPRLVRINLDEPERTEEADVPLPPTPRNRAALPTDPSMVGPHKMFADPTGRHLVLSMRSGDNYYWRSGWKKARALPKWKGIVVESIAWNRAAGNNTSGHAASKRASSMQQTTTRQILVGAQSGDIFEAVLTAPIDGDGDEGDFLDRLARRTAGAGAGGGDVDRVLRHLFSLSERQPVTGLMAVPFASPSGRSKAAVVATTSTRIYEFIGPVGKERRDDASGTDSLYAAFFEPYKGSVPNLKSELPGDVPHSELQVWAPAENKDPRALAWLTGPGVYHGLLSFVGQDVGDSVIDSANLLPYPAFVVDDAETSTAGNGRNTVAEIPLSIMLTEFHFVLLYQDRAMGINTLDDRVVFEESLPLKPRERVIGTAVDPARKTYWIYTDASIFELVVKDEDRDVWRVYLQRGAHDASLRYVKTASQRDIVLSAQGDRFFDEGRHIQAAQCYAQSFTRTFEEIVLRFIDVDARDALRYYLVTRLERLKRTDVTQRALLVTWLVEIYLSKLDELEDVAAAQAASQGVENYRLEQDLIDEELRQFLVTYKEDLDERTTFALIARHGRTEIMLHYAAVAGRHERIVRHWIEERAWDKAIQATSQQPGLSLYYRFASPLMRHAPEAAVDCWLRQPKLDARKLIPAMLQHKPKGGAVNHAVRYLRHIIDHNDNTDPAIHNFLLSLLARGDPGQETSAETNAELLHFIGTSPADPMSGLPYYDLDYALRVCAENKRQEASVRIYAKMGFFENAVDLALDEDDVELACYCADMAEMDESLRRKLWLKTAKHVVETKKDIKAATEFLALTPLLSIEDILPFFPDFTVIDSFKDEICLALEGYAARIEDLKAEMEQATESAKNIRLDIDRLSQRFVTVEADDKCGICELDVLQRQFFVFPCRHAFHADCLIAVTTRRLSPRSLRRLLDLQTQLSRATSGLIPGLPPSLTGAGAAQGSGGSSGAAATNSMTKRAGASAAAAAVASGVNAVGAGVGRGLDRLPEAIIGVLSAGLSVSVAGGRRVLAPLDPFTEPVIAYAPRGGAGAGAGHATAEGEAGAGGLDGTQGTQGTTAGAATALETRRMREEAAEVERLRGEMDSLIAGACPLCEGSIADLGRGLVGGHAARGGERDAQSLREEEEWAL